MAAALWSSTTCAPAGPRSAGVLPTHEDIVFERFFDETGGMQLIVHAPFGARVNRALGLGLRKKFCLTFDFELQAAASNDAVLLSLGPQHSFPLEDVPAFLRSHNVQDAVSQAVLRSPMFTARWRWNLNRSLAVLRRKGGRLNPFNIQRMESDDLMAAVFPSLAACQDNAPAGPVEIPDHLLVRETMRRLPHRGDGHRRAARRSCAASSRRPFACTSSTPSSPAFSRTRSSTARRSPTSTRTPRSASAARARCRCAGACRWSRASWAGSTRTRSSGCAAEAAPDVRDPDELHDVLLSLVVTRPRPEWSRAVRSAVPARAVPSRCSAADLAGVLWAATERRGEIETLFPGARFTPDHPLPPGLLRRLDARTADEAAVELDPGPSRRLRVPSPSTTSPQRPACRRPR